MRQTIGRRVACSPSLLFILALSACDKNPNSGHSDSGSTGNTGDASFGASSGGAGGTGDTGAGGAAGAGARSVPARGAVSFIVDLCNHYAGGIARDGMLPTSDGDRGEPLGDGEDSTSVSCQVTGPAPFTLSGQIAGDNQHPDAIRPGERIVFGMENGVIDGTGQGSADVTTQADAIVSGSCTLSVTANQNLGVASGRVFASFDCTDLAIPGTPVSGCIASGVFVFEHCQP